MDFREFARIDLKPSSNMASGGELLNYRGVSLLPRHARFDWIVTATPASRA
jgi:hypothetical protein